MTHNNVFLSFKNLFGEVFAEGVKLWIPFGNNRIKLRFQDLKEYVFTINGTGDWCFETLEHFKNRAGRKEKAQ
jgi:hypothetical protein